MGISQSAQPGGFEGRIENPPPAALMPGDADTAIELFGNGDLTAAVNTLPVDQYNALEDRFGLLADWVLIRQRINLATEDRQRFLRLVGTAALDAGWQLRRYAEDDYTPIQKRSASRQLKALHRLDHGKRSPAYSIFGGRKPRLPGEVKTPMTHIGTP
jgi:hypothetical protein